MDEDKQAMNSGSDPKEDDIEAHEPKRTVTLRQVIGDDAVESIERGAVNLLQMLARGTLRALGLGLLAITEKPANPQERAIDWDAIGGNGSRGPGWDIDKIILIGGGWEDHKRLPRLRRRSLEIYSLDKNIPRTTITDHARRYRQLFGNRPSQQVWESWIAWNEQQKLSD